MRSPELSRLYVQVRPDQELSAWPDERIWDELRRRLASEGFGLHEGPLLERTLVTMRSFVCEPMQHGRLFLAGDAAHIVPPTGAKGMNLALADVAVLSRVVAQWFDQGDRDGLDAYSDTCLQRV
jgi:p-hydroxybenzoate 3-monooxygenase